MNKIDAALEQIRAARGYTNDLLGHIADEDWFRQPTEGVTHIAWHVGHLAVAQYSLALKRIRGVQAGDEALVPKALFEQFGKGSQPVADPATYPSPSALREVFNQVHEQVLRETSALAEAVLLEQVGAPPHPMFTTKFGALIWSAQHEFIHIGQMALLRRLFGADPLR